MLREKSQHSKIPLNRPMRGRAVSCSSKCAASDALLWPILNPCTPTELHLWMCLMEWGSWLFCGYSAFTMPLTPTCLWSASGHQAKNGRSSPTGTWGWNSSSCCLDSSFLLCSRENTINMVILTGSISWSWGFWEFTQACLLVLFLCISNYRHGRPCRSSKLCTSSSVLCEQLHA